MKRINSLHPANAVGGWAGKERTDEMRQAPQSSLWVGRILVWFSCGAASAVAAKLATEKHGDRAEIIYCDTSESEHEDNARFMADVSQWIRREITIIKSDTYENIDDVFERTGYMAGPYGARCTTEMKKLPRQKYQDVADVHIFGYTADEQKRIEDFEYRNPDLNVEWILADKGITKTDCYQRLNEVGIKLPEMYALNFDHNNCKGCVKATSPGYWNKTRICFPEVFQRRARQSRVLGVKLVRLNGKRIFLDELPSSVGMDKPDGEIECGPVCQKPSQCDCGCRICTNEGHHCGGENCFA